MFAVITTIHSPNFPFTYSLLYTHQSQNKHVFPFSRPFEQELKLKGEECERLSHVRNQLEQELEELTASLFEVSRAWSFYAPRYRLDNWYTDITTLKHMLFIA